MPLDVLQPVQRRRRRRRRRRRLPLLLLLLAALAAGSVVAWHWWPDAGGPSAAQAAKPAAVRAPAAHEARNTSARSRRRGPALPLLAWRSPGALKHAFRPALTARAAILVDAGSGTVLWGRSPHRRLPVASTTKIMTAVLALERLAPRQLVTIAPSVPRVSPFREGLVAGESVQAWKLLYGLLLYSGNDDALALAIATAGSRPAFVAAMNEKARALGLHDSHFRSPSGVQDRDNYSSAWDMAALTRYALADPRLRTIVRTRRKAVPWSAPTNGKVYVNKNRLLATYAGADGVKTGWTTKAGHCLVASARRHGLHLVAVVLGAGDPYGDVRRLLDYGFRSRG